MTTKPCRPLLALGVLVAAAIVAVGSNAWAQSSPDDVVTEMYKLHDQGEDSPIYEPELMERFLAPGLIELINADLDRVEGKIDFDPLYGADDVEASDFAVATQSTKGDKAVVLVTFKNSGKPTRITFDLTRDGGQWKVINIRGAGWDLLKLLQ